MWKKLVGLFTKTLKLADENKQMNYIKSVGKDNDGYATVEVTPVGSEVGITLHPHMVIDDQLIKEQLMPADLKVVKAMLTAEGDVFIESKEYQGASEIYYLRSLLEKEEWWLTRKQIESQKDLLCRINKRFFNNTLHNQLLSV